MQVVLLLALLLEAVSARQQILQGSYKTVAPGTTLPTLTGVKPPYTIDFDYKTLATTWVKQWHEIVNFGANHGKRYPQIDEYPDKRRLHVRIATKSPKNWNNGCDPIQILKNNMVYHITVVIEPTFMTVYIKEGSGPHMLGCIAPYKVADIPSTIPVWMSNKMVKNYPQPGNGQVANLRFTDTAMHPTLPTVPQAGIPFTVDAKTHCGKNPWNTAFPKVAIPVGTYEVIPTGGYMSWWSSGANNYDWAVNIAFPNQGAKGARLNKRGTPAATTALALKQDFQFSITTPGMYFYIPDYPCTDNRGAVNFKIVPVMCHSSPLGGAGSIGWGSSPKLPAQLGATATIKCRPGYNPSPSNGVTKCAQVKGQTGWTPISCVAKSCGTRPSGVTWPTGCPTTLTHGQYCAVNCPAGQVASVTKLICMYGKYNTPTSGKFCHTPAPADCKGSPPLVTGGTWEGCGSVNSGDRCKLACGTGLTMNPASYAGALCSNGKYQGPWPKCEADKCDSPPKIWRGSMGAPCNVDQQIKSGTGCPFTCENGYINKWTNTASGTVTCTNGAWNIMDIKCTPAQCTQPAPLPTGAAWVSSPCVGTPHGKSCPYKCPSGMMPHQDVVCVKGVWQTGRCVKAPMWLCRCQAAFADFTTPYGPKCLTLQTTPLNNFVLSESQHTFEHEFGDGNIQRTSNPPQVVTTDKKWICTSWAP